MIVPRPWLWLWRQMHSTRKLPPIKAVRVLLSNQSDDCKTDRVSVVRLLFWLRLWYGCGGEYSGTGRKDTSSTSIIITTRLLFTCGMDPVLIYSVTIATTTTTTTTRRIVNTQSINTRIRIFFCRHHYLFIVCYCIRLCFLSYHHSILSIIIIIIIIITIIATIVVRTLCGKNSNSSNNNNKTMNTYR